MGLSHVGFGSQNYQNQCFTPVDSMNRLNRMSTDRTSCKKSWKFDRMFLEELGIHEKKWYTISSSEKGDMIKIITKNQCSTLADSMNRLNRLNRMPTSRTSCKKSWKFDRMFLEEWRIHEKKWYAIPSSEKGDMIKIITKNQCSTPADSMKRLNRMPTSRTGCKKSWKFDKIFMEK